MKPKKDKEFWPIHLNCKRCNRGLSIQEVAFSSDGRVCIVGMCPQDSEYTAVVDTWERIMQYVHEQEGFNVVGGNELVN